jgi:hypothetical protein
MSEKVKRILEFLSWLWTANRYRHWSIRCKGEHPCDPREHLSVATCWALTEPFPKIESAISRGDR